MILTQEIRSSLLIGLLLSSGSAVATCNRILLNWSVMPSTPTADFVDHSDGTVTHIPTGLMWKRCSQGQSWDGGSATCIGEAYSYTWQGALTDAEEQNFAGYSDWRLPNVKELKTVMERSCWGPAMNEAIFPAAPDAWFWSATPYVNNADLAWGVDFGFGGVSVKDKENNLNVRLVRTGG